MTADATADADELEAAVAAELPPSSTWTMPPRGYREGLALCVIDGIARQATGDDVATDLIAGFRHALGGTADQAGADDLLTAIDTAGGATAWAEAFGAKDKFTKASTLIRAGAHVLVQHSVRSTGDLVEHLKTEGLDGELGSMWTATDGLNRRTWTETAMLAGYLDPEVDRIISAYVCRSIGSDPTSTAPDRVIAALTVVAQRTGSTILPLEFAILRHEQR